MITRESAVFFAFEDGKHKTIALSGANIDGVEFPPIFLPPIRIGKRLIFGAIMATEIELPI